MKKNFKFMLVALMALLGLNSAMAAELVGSTQYTNDGLQYKILTLNTGAKTGTVSVSQSNWVAKAADKTAITINPTIKINVKGEVSGTPIDAEVTFDIVEIEADAFKNLSDVKTITFADGCKVTNIGAGAFAGTKIKVLDLRKTGVTTLHKLFEYNNVELNKVVMPTTIKALDDMALADCIQLSEVDFSGCTALTTLGDGSLSNTIVSTYDFKDCISATSVLNFTTTANPFVNATTTTNKNLKTVVLPESNSTQGVTEIGTVFANCEKLATITNLDKTKITAVGAGAFINDISLKALSFPSTLKTVQGTSAANQPFNGCKSLETLTFDGTSLVSLGDGTNDLFGDYKYNGASFDPVLKNLFISVPATSPKTSTAVQIMPGAFKGNGTTSVLEKVEIVKTGVFAGKIGDGTNPGIVLATAKDATVEFGDIDADAQLSKSITGPKGVYKSTLTIGEWGVVTTPMTDAIIDGTIASVTVGKITKGDYFLIAAGQAEKLIFTAEIGDFLVAPTTANSALTAIWFGPAENEKGVKMGSLFVPATSFDENKAPNLKDVYWYPKNTEALSAFHKNAFGTAPKGTDAKVTLHTTTAVGVGIYHEEEANLNNVIFDCEAAIPEATLIPVYNNATTGYFYGKFKASGSNFAIDKETLDDPATKDVDESGAQVVVYSAFVDEADNKLYMDPLAIKNGKYIVKAGEVVIVRIKDPKGSITAMDEPAGGQLYNVKAYPTTDLYTMRITPYGGYAVVNDLKMNSILFSSDYIGTNYVGKTLFAMVNPAKVGRLDFKPVSVTQYLPANSVYVEKNEASAANLTLVWLDGDEATGIINKMAEKTQDGAIYNLQGIRVNGAQKGVYIQNGKKFIK